MAYEQKFIPSLQQQFVDLNAGSSSALNQALAQSASDLSTALGSQFGQFMTGQQEQQQKAISQLLQVLMGQTFSPLIKQKEGILGPLLQAGGQIGAAFLA